MTSKLVNKYTKLIKVSKETHKLLKLESVNQGIKLQELIEQIILEHYGTDKIQKHKDKTKQASQ